MGEPARREKKSHTGVLLEVNPQQGSGDLAPQKSGPEDFRKRASEIAASVGEVADEFRSNLGDLMDKSPDKSWNVDAIEIAFGITVQAETGILIAKASAGTTFSAKLTFKASVALP
ncbi:CU044_2847 family protein [Amycolatopsis circi]|uniref:CU044_2847 family protein n=1 Tax=Amycolatopsis circi TaxID=871959 RepID=UPI0013BEA925|nr:CU044_2847 family protein [Amycolatopsis circi]